MALVDLLRQMDLVLEPELGYAIKRAEQSGTPLLTQLVRDQLVDDDIVARLLSAKLNLNRVDLDRRRIDLRALTMIPGAVARRFRAIPVGLRRASDGDILYVAMSNPEDPAALQAVGRLTGMRLHPLVATETALERCLARHYPPDELTDVTPFGLLPPDESFARSEVPVVVGELLTDDDLGTSPDEATLRNVKDSLLSQKSGKESGAIPAPVLSDEWLTASTQEVLEVYAPRQTVAQGSTPTQEDLAWLAGKRGAPSSSSSEPATRVDILGPTTIVCPDIGLRLWMKEKLAGVVSQLRDHASLAAAAMEDVPVANVVLIHPENEPSLIAALKALRQREIPPRVYVVSTNKAFEVLGGVDVRIEPPPDDEAMAYAVLEALVPRRRGRA